MKRISSVLAALALAATASLTVGSATAAAADPNCTGYGIDNLVDAKYIKNRTTGTNVGSVQLCERFDPNLNNTIYWTAVTLYYTMNSGDHASGLVRVKDRHTDVEFSWSPQTCSESGGTGVIIAPDRTCASAGAAHVLGRKYTGEAYVYNANNIILAVGVTNTLHV